MQLMKFGSFYIYLEKIAFVHKFTPDVLPASLTVIGMSLVFISAYNFGLPVSAIAFGIALISFSLAANRRWLSNPASANLRGNRIQIFTIFGIASLLLGLLAPLIPLPDRIELPVIAQVFFGLLLFGVVISMIKNHLPLESPLFEQPGRRAKQS